MSHRLSLIEIAERAKRPKKPRPRVKVKTPKKYQDYLDDHGIPMPPMLPTISNEELDSGILLPTMFNNRPTRKRKNKK